jgi:hypothetical protein
MKSHGAKDENSAEMLSLLLDGQWQRSIRLWVCSADEGY